MDINSIKDQAGLELVTFLVLAKKKSKFQKVDLAIFAVRELGPKYPYFGQGIKHSKTENDKKSKLFSSVKDTIKRKKIPISPTGKTNLGQARIELVTFLFFSLV